MIVIVTIVFLSVSAILGVAVHRLLETSGQYTYIPSSFGEFQSYSILTSILWLEYGVSTSHTPPEE